jgi:ABC-type protease/lipase transport system fused ATPase/permease subunit
MQSENLQRTPLCHEIIKYRFKSHHENEFQQSLGDMDTLEGFGTGSGSTATSSLPTLSPFVVKGRLYHLFKDAQ